MIRGEGFRAMRLDEEQAVPVLGGTLDWLPVRRRLGIRAFGCNAYRAAKAGDEVVEEHDEGDGEGGGHQEIYVVLRGRATFTVGGEQLDAPAPTVVFLEQPDVRRHAVAAEDDTLVLAVGGWPDRAFEVSAWEPVFLADDAMSRGAWAQAAEILEREAGDEHRDAAPVQYQLACCHARLGDLDRAAQELRAALGAEPERVRGWADGDEDLDALRDREDWPL